MKTQRYIIDDSAHFLAQNKLKKLCLQARHKRSDSKLRGEINTNSCLVTWT
jgi:hypothetical protein